MNDSALTGDALLKRPDELTGNDVRDPGGGNGWRHLLYAARQYIDDLREEIAELKEETSILSDDVDDLERQLNDRDELRRLIPDYRRSH